MPGRTGPVLWDGISNETAKVGSSDSCMLVDTFAPESFCALEASGQLCRRDANLHGCIHVLCTVYQLLVGLAPLSPSAEHN